MTDEQLRQAIKLFPEGSRAQAVALQIEKRARDASGEARDAESAPVPLVRPAGEARVGERVDHAIVDEDRIGQGGLMEKYRDNIRAIQLLGELDAANRNATPAEQQELARYVGWGAIKGVFDPENKTWARQHAELKALLTDAEWAAASRSQLDAFYSPAAAVNAMYAGLARMGFDGGRMIDPSMGSGNFFGMMPADMRRESSLHGVELDILTSRVAAALYPTARISKATGFQAYSAPAGYFDLVIGNPPFGSQAIADERGSAYSGWSIHNYFFAKSIELLRPGGLMAMEVSHYFLDKLDPHVRRWISRRAELVSGVRMPNTAFKANANTDVVVDILIFRRLDNELALGQDEVPDWLQTTDVEIPNPKTGESALLPVNNYFLKNPQNVLGVHSATGSMYRANDYTVEPDTSLGDLETRLNVWVQGLPQGIYARVQRDNDIEVSAAAADVPEHVKEGSFFIVEGDKGPQVWQRLVDMHGQRRALPWEAPNEKAVDRMTSMIRIREALRAQMRLERSEQAIDGQIEAHRRQLNRVYDEFRSKHGFLNDPVNRRIFLDDTESPLLQALEFDYEKAITPAYAEEHGLEPRAARAVKADIFSRRVLFPPGELEVVETAKDALVHSLNQRGRVDLDYMRRAYGRSDEEILAELGELIFLDPKDGPVTADEYLSGDVKTKLELAIDATRHDGAMLRNVDALQRVIPVDKLPSEIHASIGAMWIPPRHYEAFATEISGGSAKFTYVRATGQWITGDKRGVDYAKNNGEFGTPKMGALDILGQAMNSRAPEVKRPVEIEGQTRYVTDEEQTEAARQAADKIKSHWESWLWSDGERAMELAGIYNDRFNRIVERKYDGSHLTFPGMSSAVTLLAHQKNAAWRGLQDRAMLLDHVVGAGKTFESIALLMEMRRLGICKKPMLVVPNHLTLQWRSDFYRLYPGANVLAATPQDFDKDNRERLFSKIVTGNWDAVVIGHSALKKIPLPPGAEVEVIGEQIADISSAIEDMKRERGDRHVIRDMEKIKSNLEAKVTKLKEKAGGKTKVVDMEDLGIDALVVDEAHEFKNLFFNTQMTRVAGLGNPAGSGKAFDLFVKTRWLQNTYGDDVPLVHATGTPVSNSLAEMFTVQRYLQYNHLKAQGLHVFDAWAKQYGDVQNVYEVAPSGTGYRLSQRFAKFKNLGSLMGEYRSFADVVTLSDLKAQEVARGKVFPVPKLAGGKPQNIVVPRSRLQEAFFGVPEIARDEAGRIRFEFNPDPSKPVQIVKAEDGRFELRQKHNGEYASFGMRRYETQEELAYMTALAAVTPVMHIDPKSIIGQFDNLRQITRETKGKVNALSLTGLANKAGLDYRLIDPAAPDDPNSKINHAIAKMMELWTKWEADKGTQLVFCDLSVPLSAKAKMATKEKRVYVRDGDGALTHKKGTFHTPSGHEELAYYLVASGRKNERSFSVYDPRTGQLMKEGLDSKPEAHQFVARFIAQADGPERWLAMREQSLPIGADEIDEYKDLQSLDVDGDAADIEVSLADVEGACGPGGFSVYDDMKAKLIARGVPESQIEFIHDHDTPQAKANLFKRTNAGDVRFLFGSTPKMGAGTNVQQRIVGLHHIDAPYRPSDLEQREGRGIRRGNHLYDRDPEGFELSVFRYATSQTYDTRRWQLLEHKAAGIEQLRNYTVGVNEIEDVTTEASNSADMKAAASGNPLILKETQLANEVKKLRNLERAHRDSQFSATSRYGGLRKYVTHYGPKQLEQLQGLYEEHINAKALATYAGRVLGTKDEVMDAVEDIHRRIATAGGVKALTYRGLDFAFRQDATGIYDMTLPDGDLRRMETMSRAGVVTRMENFCEGLDRSIAVVKAQIARSEQEALSMKDMLDQPFDQEKELQAVIAEHGKVQRALRKSNSLAAVKPEEAKAFQAAVEVQKAKLRSMGFGEAVADIEREEKADGGIASPGLGGTPQGGQGGSAAVAPPEGDFTGQIVRVGPGFAIQKVNRAGDTMTHRLDHGSDARLEPGQVVTIKYRGGQAEIVERDIGVQMGL